MKNEALEWRMYGLVPYNISPIQQAIQYGHAVVEYFNKYNDDTVGGLFEWRTRDKTFIILNGGTTNGTINPKPKQSPPEYLGSLNNHLVRLFNNKVAFSSFYEPDLGDQLTALVFLVDERVFDREKYPDFMSFLQQKLGGVTQMIRGDGYTKPLREEYSDYYQEWENIIGGPTNVWLIEFLKQFRLA